MPMFVRTFLLRAAQAFRASDYGCKSGGSTHVQNPMGIPWVTASAMPGVYLSVLRLLHNMLTGDKAVQTVLSTPYEHPEGKNAIAHPQVTVDGAAPDLIPASDLATTARTAVQPAVPALRPALGIPTAGVPLPCTPFPPAASATTGRQVTRVHTPVAPPVPNHATPHAQVAQPCAVPASAELSAAGGARKLPIPRAMVIPVPSPAPVRSAATAASRTPATTRTTLPKAHTDTSKRVWTPGPAPAAESPESNLPRGKYLRTPSVRTGDARRDFLDILNEMSLPPTSRLPPRAYWSNLPSMDATPVTAFVQHGGRTSAQSGLPKGAP